MTMARLEQITRAGYQAKFQWECEFDDSGIATPELLAHSTVRQSHLCTPDALYSVCRRQENLSVHMQVIQVSRGPSCLHRGDASKDKEACLRNKGLIKFSIVPPERYHTMIPFGANQKLMLCLCRTCVVTSNTGEGCQKADE